jgi:creatinine amidohydrolase
MHVLEELTAPALSSLLGAGVTTGVVPFGSIEHHGAHLAIGADALLADAVARQVAQELDAILAPTVRVGDADQHARLTGTMTLRADTLSDVAVQLIESLIRQGFTRIVLVSTHGGNRPALDTAIARVRATSGGAVVCAPTGDVGPSPGAHSGEWLTSVMLALRPDLVRLENAASELAVELRAANPERGARHFQRFVASIVAEARAASSAHFDSPRRVSCR